MNTEEKEDSSNTDPSPRYDTDFPPIASFSTPTRLATVEEEKTETQELDSEDSSPGRSVPVPAEEESVALPSSSSGSTGSDFVPSPTYRTLSSTDIPTTRSRAQRTEDPSSEPPTPTSAWGAEGDTTRFTREVERTVSPQPNTSPFRLDILPTRRSRSLTRTPIPRGDTTHSEPPEIEPPRRSLLRRAASQAASVVELALSPITTRSGRA
jgi:hypothetical protein